MLKFTWDETKAATNLAKHGVSFEEAATVFGDLLAISFNDPDHSNEEHRFLTFDFWRVGEASGVVGGQRGTRQRHQNYQRPQGD